MPIQDRDTFISVPTTLDAIHHSDYKSSYYEVHTAIRSRVGTSPKQDNFCVCWPSVESLSEKYGHTRDTICEATAWLEKNGYQFTTRRRRNSNIYTVVIRRERFLELVRLEGPGRAKEDYINWIEEQKAIARGRKGKATVEEEPRERGASDIKAVPFPDPGWPEVVDPITPSPTKKSSSVLPKLDSPTTETRTKDPEDLERELFPGPFSRRVFD
jgi:hypothetical protein